LWFFWCFLRLWATANYCRAGIKSLRGTRVITEKEEGKVKGVDEKKRMKESLKCWKEKEKSKN
jgi:hypothetical protein